MQRNIAIVGSGPAGVYAAEALAKAEKNVSIYVFEALFCPYGLVRSGVAPDHHKIKEVTKLFDKTFSRENVHLLANIKIGEDLSLECLKEHFDATIFCTGAHQDRTLNIPGENLPNVNTATNFVGWYNCHPWFQDLKFELSASEIAVIGQGNVAVDVTRILLKPVEELSKTDISTSALEALAKSNVKKVYMIGRRGPLQAAFTDKELRELGEIKDVYVKVRSEELILTDEEKTWLNSAPKGLQKNYSILQDFSASEYSGQPKTLEIRFFQSPTRFLGNSQLESIELVRNELKGDLNNRKAVPTDKIENLKVQLALKSVGYRGQNLLSLPFEESRGVFKNELGLISDSDGAFFTSGWIKRGPSGVIGTNKADSVETVNTLLVSLTSLPRASKSPQDLISNLKSKGLTIIDFQSWKLIEEEEFRRGNNSTRRKFLNNAEALSFLKSL